MRIPLALIVIAVVVVAVSFIADHPGRVEIDWQDWEIETSVGVLGAALLAAAGALAAIIALLRGAVALPGKARARRRERRRRAGYAALTGGLAALAASDAHEARRQARRALPLLEDLPLALVLSAQAARAEGDLPAARQALTAMLDQPATRMIGLRGLFDDAVQQGDRAAALEFARQARRLQPRARWAIEGALALELRAGLWEEARVTLAEAERQGIVSAERARHQRGAILIELSRTAARHGELRGAVAFAARAQPLVPDLATAAAAHARALLALGRGRAAARVIARAWRHAPHPELAELDAECHRDQSALARVGSAQTLAAANPDAEASHVLVAEAALAARLWGEARHHLDRAVEKAGAAGPSRRLCLLMARLEDGENPGSGAARNWLVRAVEALPEPRYHCAQCDAESPDWHALCPHCGHFDTLSWGRTAARTAAPALLPAPNPSLPAPTGLAPAGQ